MSYFATISGAKLEGDQIDGLRLVPALAAQEYVRTRVPAIAALDGEPVYFCDDTRPAPLTTSSEVLRTKRLRLAPLRATRSCSCSRYASAQTLYCVSGIHIANALTLKGWSRANPFPRRPA